MDSATINVLAAVRLVSVVRYRENLSKEPKFKVTVVTSEVSARDLLTAPDKRPDVFVVDNGLGNIFELIRELRKTYVSLLIILVDEEADFGMPGRADDVTTDPFKDDELIRKIKRLFEERRLATLRADELPSVRSFAKSLHRASKGLGKQQAAVAAVRELGYDYVAFYSIAPTTPPSLSLGAHVGPNAILSMIPARADYSGLLGWVAQNGKSKVVGPDDQPNYILVEKGKYGAAVCIPIGSALRFGVILACREQLASIKPDNVMMLELVGGQLASALAHEQRG